MSPRHLLACALLIHALANTAHAGDCTWESTKRPFGIPHSGATDVSPSTSIIIVSFLRPEWVQVTAAGILVPTDGVEQLGRFAEPVAWVWRVLPAKSLQPSTQYIVTSLHEGNRIELTRFLTAPTHVHPEVDWKVPLDVQFWRVHFLGKTGATREYESFIQIGHSPAKISTTPPESTLYSMRVFPLDEYHGGETVWYTGAALFKGKAPTPPGYAAGCWSPSFDPTRFYCIDPHVQGYGDLAPPHGQTASVGKCIAVTQIVVGGTADGGVQRADATVLPQPSGGCSIASPATAYPPTGALLPVLFLLILAFSIRSKLQQLRSRELPALLQRSPDRPRSCRFLLADLLENSIAMSFASSPSTTQTRSRVSAIEPISWNPVSQRDTVSGAQMRSKLINNFGVPPQQIDCSSTKWDVDCPQCYKIFRDEFLIEAGPGSCEAF